MLAATGSMRLAGIVLFGNGCPVSGSRMRGREDAAPLVRGHHVAGAQHALLQPRALVIREEEHAVPHQRPAEVAAELVLLVGGLRLVGGLGEVVDGVHPIVAVEVVRRAAEAIGAGLGADDDGRARRPAVFGGVGTGDDLELVDRVHRRTRQLRGELLHVGREAVVGHAVEQEVVLQAAIAVHADAAGAARRSAAGLFRIAVALHARHHRQQVVPVADRQRQLVHFIRVDHGAQHRGFGAEERRDALDLHRLADRPDRERHVEARAGAQLEADGLLESLEPGGLDLHQVFARREVQNEVHTRRSTSSRSLQYPCPGS